MAKTKQKILDQARHLFNEHGYGQVTNRMIASALAMSYGNLNSHFRKREDILEALYFEMVAVFDQRVQGLVVSQVTLATLQAEVQTSMERMVAYRFFWTDLYFILKSNPSIKAHFTQARAERLRGYRLLFDFFIQQGLLHPPSFPTENPHLMDRLNAYSNTWLYATEQYEREEESQALIRRAAFHLLSMLYPYLSPAGQRDFRNLFPTLLRN